MRPAWFPPVTKPKIHLEAQPHCTKPLLKTNCAHCSTHSRGHKTLSWSLFTSIRQENTEGIWVIFSPKPTAPRALQVNLCRAPLLPIWSIREELM